MSTEPRAPGLWTEQIRVCPICNNYVSSSRYQSHVVHCRDAIAARKTGYPVPTAQRRICGWDAGHDRGV